MGKTTDFRYNTGATRVPWAAVGENYNVSDLMEIIRFLMQGEGKEYDDAIAAVWEQVKKLDKLATPPGKLSRSSRRSIKRISWHRFKHFRYKRYFRL